jgi:hypothetical protein
MPMPYFGDKVVLTQPDGTRLEARCWGDQSNAVFETLDGFTIIKDKATEFYQYAQKTATAATLVPSGYQANKVDPQALGIIRSMRANAPETSRLEALPLGTKTRWETRREITKMQMRSVLVSGPGILAAPPGRQTVGDYVGLCIPIEFPDVLATIPVSEINKFCNQPSYRGFGNNGSVYDYFLDNSNQKLRYQTLVTPYYRAKQEKRYYTEPEVPYGIRAQELVVEAIESLKRDGFDFSKLSVDSQGFVDEYRLRGRSGQRLG